MMKYLSMLTAAMLALQVMPAVAANPSLEDFYDQAPAVGMQTVAPADSDAPPAAPKDEALKAGSHVVTSVSKCYDDLGAEDAAEIKRNSLTPYADCQKRLRERALQKKAAAAQAPVAETPRNYKRVTESAEDADSPVEAAPVKKK